MNDLFVPYKLAVILKEKGFEEYGFGYYRTITTYEDESLNEWNLIISDRKPYGFVNGGGNVLYAPIFQEVQDWFLEKHNIKIDFEKGINPTNYYTVVKDYHREKEHNYKYLPEHWFNTKREALIDSILLALELIII